MLICIISKQEVKMSKLSAYWRYRDRRLQYEFLPAAQEIIETPTSPLGHIVIWMTVLLLMTAGAWLYFGKLDVVVSGQGKLASESGTKILQSSASGTVVDIKVREGQRIKKGDTVVELDKKVAQQNVESVEKTLAIAKIERSIAKGVSSSIVMDDINKSGLTEETKQSLIEKMHAQNDILESRKLLSSTNLTNLQKQLSQLDSVGKDLNDMLTRDKAKEQQINKLIEHGAPLQQMQLRSDLNSVRQKIASLESSLSSQKHQMAQVESAIDNAKNQAAVSLNELRVSNTATAISQDNKIIELENSLTRARVALEQTTIVAPVDGTVLSLKTNTIGGVVSAAQIIAEITPLEESLVVEASLQSRDIGFVNVGQRVVVKVDAYSFQRYGYLSGTVQSISPDAIVNDKLGLIYRIKVKLDSLKTSKNIELKMIPGMNSVVEITTGNRRAIEFLLDPLISHVDGSLEVR